MHDAGIDDCPQRSTYAIGVRRLRVVHSDDSFDHVRKYGNERAPAHDDRHDSAASAAEASQRAMHTDDARRRTKPGGNEPESPRGGSEKARSSDEIGRCRFVGVGDEALAHGIDEYVHGV